MSKDNDVYLSITISVKEFDGSMTERERERETDRQTDRNVEEEWRERGQRDGDAGKVRGKDM